MKFTLSPLIITDEMLDAMKYVLHFELPGLPKGMNGSHGHWRAASAIRKKWRKDSYLAASQRHPADGPLQKCRITCVRYSSSASDFDNLVASFKPIIDGLIDAKIIVNDNEKCVVERYYKNEKAKPKQGKISVTVEEL